MKLIVLFALFIGVLMGSVCGFIIGQSLPFTAGAVPSRAGLIGIYNVTTTDNVIADGFGGAVSVDKFARPLISPSSTFNVTAN